MDAANGFHISTARTGDDVVIRVSGDLDFTATGMFEEAIEAAVDASTPSLLVDCEEVTFIDSETLKLLLRIQAKLSESSQLLRLQNCSKPVQRIIRLLGLEDVLCQST